VSSPDSELIARVLAANDRESFAELVHRHQSAVRLFLRHLTRGNSALADDLAQETFFQAWRGLARFEGRATFSTWLLGIAHNQWRNACRRQRTELAAARDLAAPDVSPCFVRHSDLQQDLAAAIGELSPGEQHTVHLCFHQGLTHSEAAEVLGWPLGTVKTDLLRAKEKLRLRLSSWNLHA
jgi:RNA polymerase sigma factor (sigma-70 family)